METLKISYRGKAISLLARKLKDLTREGWEFLKLDSKQIFLGRRWRDV